MRGSVLAATALASLGGISYVDRATDRHDHHNATHDVLTVTRAEIERFKDQLSALMAGKADCHSERMQS